MGWKSIEIPAKLVGEEVTKKSGLYEYSRTQIFLPEKSEYPGYMFWHPTKLVSRGSDGRTAFLSYKTPGFLFKLEKRDREPGRRYKRFELNVPAFEAIYLPLEETILQKRKKKQDALDAQAGSIVLYRRVNYDSADVWFEFIPNNGKLKSRVYVSTEAPVIIADNVTRAVFNSSIDSLEDMRQNLKMFASVIAQLQFGTYRKVISPEKEQLIHTAQMALDDCIVQARQMIEAKNLGIN